MFRLTMPYMDAEAEVGGGVAEPVVETVVEPTVEPTPEEPKEDKVPLATLMEEKRKRKDLERQLREFKEKQLDADVVLTKTQLKQKYVAKGVDEDLAEAFAEEFASLKSEVKKASFKELEDTGIDDDLKELSKDGFFSDALTFKKEIQDTLKSYKAKGIDLDVEDAYFKVRGKSRLNEYRTEIEQKALLNRRNAEDKKLPSATPAAVKDPYPLDENDKKALEGLQKAMPNAGWDAKKYYTTMKG
jgi:hypothetical protein